MTGQEFWEKVYLDNAKSDPGFALEQANKAYACWMFYFGGKTEENLEKMVKIYQSALMDKL